jgi:leucyl-tRNA synthetase
MPRYNPAEIEPRWQRYWEANATFRTPDLPVGDKLYVLDMFPYPSGAGLHVGHPEGYTATDIVCRFERMRGKCVLHPIGFDAFGLPAEEHAIATNTPPRISTEANIANFRRQLKMLGFTYDWSRELATTDVEYFRWTQWIFLVLFDTWYDRSARRGRPISELPIPDSVQAEGPNAVRRYQDQHRLAYQSDELVNWCPALGTVLANEEVIGGRSERGDHPVERTALRQWMLRITAYADRLDRDLDELDWPEGIKKLQRDWIGRSEGADIDFFAGDAAQYNAWCETRGREGFPAQPPGDVLRVFTTRPDTLFGATYVVVAPEHPAVLELTTPGQRRQVEEYVERALARSDRDRLQGARHKTGVATGAHVINPANGQPIPVWVADYVLGGYGTGAIMAVPAHDQRDHEFARQFGLPIIAVVDPGSREDLDRDRVLAGEMCFTGDGKAIESGAYNGLASAAFRARIVSDLTARGTGRAAINYKLRDWLFSRQRFWGEPFPILHELDKDGQPTGLVRTVPESALPVDLPHLDDFRPHGRPEPPLEKAPYDWLFPVIDGRRHKRETNTMPQWAGSCWYYLRFIDPKNNRRFVDEQKERQWMPIDLYIGGAEHAVLHLLYARFWHKVLYDRGYVSHGEPFRKLVNQGMILGEMEFTGYRCFDEQWLSADKVTENENHQPVRIADGAAVHAVRLDHDQVEKVGDSFVLRSDPTVRVDARAHKMSKARGNVVNPDEIVAEYGADSLRLYEMFMGPLEAVKPWSMTGVNGVRSFLDRVWRMVVDAAADQPALNPAIVDAAADDDQRRVLHKTIKSVTEDIEALAFNTAIARMMEFVNYFTKQDRRPREVIEAFVLILSPFAPHIAEELWRLLGHEQTLAYEPWPAWQRQWAEDETLEIPVQIGGKLRAKIVVPRGATRDELVAAAQADGRIAQLLNGKRLVKVIVVPDRLVNFVAV